MALSSLRVVASIGTRVATRGRSVACVPWHLSRCSGSAPDRACASVGYAANCWELLGTAWHRWTTAATHAFSCATCAVHRSHERSQDLSARAIRIRDVVIRQHRTCIQQVLKITFRSPCFQDIKAMPRRNSQPALANFQCYNCLQYGHFAYQCLVSAYSRVASG